MSSEVTAMSKGEQTRQRIIEEAAPLFNQRGYEGCSLQDIMGATGLEKGGIYRHFQNKEELAAEAFDFAWSTMSAKRRQNLEAIPDPIARIKQHIANFVARSSFPGGCPLLNTAVDADNGKPVLRERVRKALHGWRAMLHRILQEGIDSGTIRADIEPTRISTILIASLEGAMLLSRIERHDQSRREMLDYLDAWIDSELRPAPASRRR